MVSAANICILCKGSRALCGHAVCPKLATIRVKPRIKEYAKTEFFGPSPSVFVGRIGYPRLNIGPMATFEELENVADTPSSWMSMSYDKIVELRSLLLRSKQPENIFSKSNLVQEVQELALASEPTDIEMHFKKKPVYRVSFSDVVQPMGPSASLDKLRITENPKIPKKVDSIVSDEMLAVESVHNLYNIDLDVYKITTIFSTGALGMGENKKLVPTRWSITATDDIITKQLIAEIKDYPSVNKFTIFESEYLSNNFCILLMPGNWEYENFEAWAPGSFWSKELKDTFVVEEYEPYKGRTKYADKEGGGYYAARIGVVEGLKKMRRQARVVVFREVYEGYTVPLGVWVVRETARKAMRSKPVEFDTLKEALKHINSKLRIPIKDYIKQSKILKQKRLTDF